MEINSMTHLLSPSEAESFRARAAIIMFKSSSSAYLEYRDIRQDGSFGYGKPVSNHFLQSLTSRFSIEYRNIPHGMIPDNMIYCDTRKGKEVYVWYNPPRKRNRFFNSKLSLEDGEYSVPGTLYLVKGTELRVFCFSGKKPNEKEVLLGVPYFNVYLDGLVCMGSARPNIPQGENLTYETLMNAWENAFWNSIDVHTNGSPSTKCNLIDAIRKYKDIDFDTRCLVKRPDNLTLESLLKKLK